MGSFNIQCKVTGSTITPEEEVVTLLLEPNGSYGGSSDPTDKKTPDFLIGSLPVSGIYSDYGHTEAAAQNLATQFSKDIYDYDFSEETNDDFGSRGLRLSIDGPISDYEENTYVWTIHKTVYLALIKDSNFSNDDARTFIEENLELFHPKLVEKILSHDEIDENLIEIASLIDGLDRLGYQFLYQGNQSYGRGPKGEINKLASNKLLCPESSKEKLSSYICGFTGKAIAPGTKIRVIPLESRLSEKDNPIFLNTHNTCGVNGLAGIGFDATIENDGTISHGKLSKWQNTLLTISDDENKLDSTTAISNLMSGTLKVPRKSKFKKLATVSKKAFDSAVSNNPSSFHDDFLLYSKMLMDAFDLDNKTLLDLDLLAKHAEEKDSPFLKDALSMQNQEANDGYMESLLKNKTTDEAKDMVAKAIRNDIIRHALTYGVPVKDSEWNRHNLFCESLTNKGILGDSLSDLLSYSIQTSSGRKGSKDQLLSTLSNIHGIVKELAEDTSYIQGLTRHSMQLTPSYKSSGKYSISEQHKLIDEIEEIMATQVVQFSIDRDYC